MSELCLDSKTGGREQQPQASPQPEPAPAPAPDPPEKTVLNALGRRVSASDLDAALIKYNGNRHLAATYLSVEYRRLACFISQHKPLSDKWGKKEGGQPGNRNQSPTGLGTSPSPVSKGELPTGLVPSDIAGDELAKLVAKEDDDVKRGMINLGSTEAEAHAAMSGFKGVRKRHIESTLGLTTMGIAMNFQRMSAVLRKLEARIEAAGFSVNEKGDPSEETMVMEAYVAISEEMRRTAELCWKGQLILAKVESLKREAKPGKPNSRAGFKPKLKPIDV